MTLPDASFESGNQETIRWERPSHRLCKSHLRAH